MTPVILKIIQNGVRLRGAKAILSPRRNISNHLVFRRQPSSLTPRKLTLSWGLVHN